MGRDRRGTCNKATSKVEMQHKKFEGNKKHSPQFYKKLLTKQEHIRSVYRHKTRTNKGPVYENITVDTEEHAAYGTNKSGNPNPRSKIGRNVKQ